MSEMNRLPPRERYKRDPHFRVLVDTLYSQLAAANYTPTELREAVMLAAIVHEDYRPRRYFLDPDGKLVRDETP